ncbi:non-homologous end-joining DNA ligase [Nocardioides sp. GY 10127]|uniref:non-homologous end-joining DNA ligase n=1 Tax=Nocardioides sp. GY 10127 TaxID=2569762 RepID=UPI0010A79EE3|nr:non-homologous end-joining DNA ligase [Nocardioides sp. GY 10127]TIC81635.1 ATP-dependent DNA ligase [Nocardioides sp. GY 10127]
MSPAGEEVLVEVDGRRLRISNLDKVLYPRTGTTKGEVLHYYATIAPVLLPHLAGRAITRIRWPHGVGDGSFYEKNAPQGTPPWVRVVEVPTSGTRGESRHGDVLRMPVVDDLATLTWLANLAALELHAHQWQVGRSGRPRRADRLVVDLDPGEDVGLQQCCEVALAVRALLAGEEVDGERLDGLADEPLDVVPVLSGSKGLHLYAPLSPRRPSEETSALAQRLAEALARARPRAVTATMTKSRRVGRVFLDWSQNAASKTTVSPYSLRGRERPTVAAPVTWAEVEAGAQDPFGLEQLPFTAVLERVAEHGDLAAVLLPDRTA